MATTQGPITIEDIDAELPEEAHEYRVVGPPGCGKTTYLGRQVERAVNKGRNPFICSLTKAAAAEVSGRDLPIPFGCLGTLHSHCFYTLGQPKIADDKKQLRDWNERYPLYAITIGPNDSASKLDSDNIEPAINGTHGDQLLAEYNMYRARMDTNLPGRLQAFAKRWTAWKNENGLKDFTDLIEICLRDVEQAPTNPDVLFLDEAQDMSLLEMTLLRKWGAAATQTIIVGDPDQAIFTWRGADPRAFTNPALPPEQIRLLANSYRLPKLVHNHALNWINTTPGRSPIKYNPRDEEGEVRTINQDFRTPAQAVADAENYLAKGKTVMFLATCAYMLQPTIDALKSMAIPFHNPYRSTNGAWNPLARRANEGSGVQRLLHFLSLSEHGEWTADQVRNWTKNVKTKGVLNPGGKGIANSLQDGPFGCVDWDDLHEIFTEDAIEAGLNGDLDWYQEKLTTAKKQGSQFPIIIARNRGVETLEKSPQVIVGTIHSVKGAEADVVYLYPDMSVAGSNSWLGTDRQKATVYRLFYVAMTRAKESLIFCKPAEDGKAIDFQVNQVVAQSRS